MDIWEFGPYFVLLLVFERHYWMQIVKTNWALLTRQTDPDFMIWCQKSVGKMIMPDCKNPHSISYQILLWTLLGYVLTVCTHDSHYFFVCTIVCFFLFVLIMAWHSEFKTDSLHRSPYTEATFHFFYVALTGFILMALKILSVSADTTLLYRALSLSVYCSERLGLV